MKGILILILLLALGGFVWWYMALPPFDKTTVVPTNSNTTTSTNKSSTTSTVGSSTIQIKDFKYNPGTLTVKAGATVTVSNMDVAGHSVTADDGSFDTGVLSQGENGTFTAPTTPGTYKFHCLPHPSITGTLIVQ